MWEMDTIFSAKQLLDAKNRMIRKFTGK